MFNLKDGKVDEKYVIDDSEFCISPVWINGVEGSRLVSKDGLTVLETIEEIIDYFHMPTLYIWVDKKCVFFREGRDIIYVLYPGPDNRTLIRCGIMGCGWDKEIYETEKENMIAGILEEQEEIKEGIEEIKKFLSDPWAEYKAKKKSYEEKLGKCRAATEYRIVEDKKRLKILEKNLEYTRDSILEILKGEKINREGN